MKIALATILALTSPAAMAGDYYYRPVGHTTTQSCYKKVMREEYIPPHRSHYGEGYINRYYDTEEVPCWTLGHRPYRPSYPCLLYTSPSPRDRPLSRMPSSA